MNASTTTTGRATETRNFMRLRPPYRHAAEAELNSLVVTLVQRSIIMKSYQGKWGAGYPARRKSMQSLRRLVQLTGLTTSVVLVALLVSFHSAQAQSGNGTLSISVRACAADAKAGIVVSTASVNPEEVTKGQSGQPISVPAGTYDVEITCTDLIDHPSQTLRGVKIGAGETVEREASFPCGETTLHIKRGGKNLSTKIDVTLVKAGGEKCPTTVRSKQRFKSSPGNYEAEILLGRGRKKAVHTIDGIQVYDGAVRNIPVNL